MSKGRDPLELLQRALDASRGMREALERDDLDACERMAQARQELLLELPQPLPDPPAAELVALLRAVRAADAELLARMGVLHQALGEELAALRARRRLPYEPPPSTSELVDQRI